MGSALNSRRWLSTRAIAGVCVAAALFATLAACSAKKAIPYLPQASALPPPPVSSPPPTQKQATLAQLAGLRTRTGPTPTGFSGLKFGTGYHTVPGGSHCNSRDFVLKRDMVDITLEPGTTCTLNSGALFDRYTGTWVWYVRKAQVHTVVLDYVVSLSDAWNAGASTWAPTVLARFANDTDELVAASTTAITQKADRTADGWLPPDVADRCSYVGEQIKVKASYLLTVTAAERAAMKAVIDSCPNTFAAPRPTTSPPPMPTPAPTPSKKPRPSASKTP